MKHSAVLLTLMLTVITALAQKQSSIVPNTKPYLLNDNDRKLYTLSIDQKKVGLLHDTVEYGKRFKIFYVPVLLNNESSHKLKFLSMTCSWYVDFGVDDKRLSILGWICDSNFPQQLTVRPHHSLFRLIPVHFRNAPVKSGTKFRIRMRLCVITSNNLRAGFDSYANHTNYFNRIWSNEVVVP